MTELIQPIQNDSFLNLLDELRDELEMISTTNALTTNVDGDDDIENAVTKCQTIVDTIAADFVNKKNFNTSGFTHVSKALPANSLNNDVLYIGINKDGFACVFNVLTERKDYPEPISCYYTTGDEVQETQLQMEGLVWWKILEFPTFQDFYDEGFAAKNERIDSNPYPKNSPEHQHWRKGWMCADELPF